MSIKTVLAALGVAGAVFAPAVLQGEFYLPPGEKAPPIKGIAHDGKTYSLADLTKSKPVFVVFWKERCPHNPRASALFNALAKAYEGKATLLGVVSATSDGAKAWAEQFALSYALLPDGDKAVIGAYKMRFSIGTVQVGSDGKIAKVFEGYGLDAMKQLNEAMAAAAGVKLAEVDLSGAPGRRTWG